MGPSTASSEHLSGGNLFLVQQVIQRIYEEPMVVPRRTQETQYQPGCEGPRGKSWPLGKGKGVGRVGRMRGK